MAQAWKVRLPDGRVVRPGEWSSTPLYSTVEVDDGTISSALRAFSYGQRGRVPGSVGPRVATLADTNLQGKGAILAENEELLLYTLQIELFLITTDNTTSSDFFTNNGDIGPGDPPDVSIENVLRMQADTLVAIRIANTKEYIREPLGFFPAAMGVHHYMGETVRESGANHIAIGSNGCTSVGANRVLATPHHIAPGEAFTVDFTFPNGQVSSLELGDDSDARIRCRIYADGYRRRPVA